MAIGNTPKSPHGEIFTLKGVLTHLPACKVTGSVKKKINKSQAGSKKLYATGIPGREYGQLGVRH